MLVRLTPSHVNETPVDVEVDLGRPINAEARDQCPHELRYRLVRMYALLKIDPDGVMINVCDYCGTDLNSKEWER